MNETKVSAREVIYWLYLHEYFLFNQTTNRQCRDITVEIQMCKIYSCTDNLVKLAIIIMSGNGSFSLLCCSTADENKEFQKLRQKVKGGMQNSDTNI